LISAGNGIPDFKDERSDFGQDEQVGSKSNARKPSAILEEIESMFGSPDIESMSDFLLDDSGAMNLHPTSSDGEELLG
jgi:hypothetical protein